MNEHRIHQIFNISVFFKGLHALIECGSGLLLYVVTTAQIVRFVNRLTLEELVEDPRDLVATRLLDWAQHLSINTQDFYAYYLLSHGLIKLFLVVGLLRGRLWSYPASLAALGAFIGYQLYRYYYTHSIGLILLTVFDLLVMMLIWHEYRLVRNHRTIA